MNKKLALSLKALAPVAVVTLLTVGIAQLLRKYTIVGPVNGDFGQPYVPEYTSVVYFGFLSLILIGLIFSVWQAWKLQGFLRYLVLTVLALCLPIQYLVLISAQMFLFGK